MPSTSRGIDLALALAPDAPERLTLPSFLEDVVARFGPRIAMRFAGTDLRYAELADHVRRLAAALVAAGVGRGERVAILIANRPEWATAVFAIARLGAIAVPVSTPPRLSISPVCRTCAASSVSMQGKASAP